jgi:hypothetical protein
LAARRRGRDRRSREAARSLSRVDACNPLLQAHPTWARDEHEGRGISTSLTPVSGCLLPPSRSASRRPIWAGARGDISLVGPGTPGLETPTRSMIGSLLYLCASRPDIMLSVCMCARFQADPKEAHLTAVKRILRYLVYTPKFGLWYPRGSTFDLIGYSDADWAGCKINRKSTSGTCQFLGRSLVSWASKKQNSVALSTAEAKYIAAGHCCAQLLWMRQTLRDYV